jgi:hypothetical protein
MKKKIYGIFICTLLITTILSTTGLCDISEIEEFYTKENLGQFEEGEYGDAPEGDTVIAYPSSGVTGSFPTCSCCGPSGWVYHNNFGAWFGPAYDFEIEGNAGNCPNFPPYDQDECFNDGDAGLIIPQPFTIDNTITVVPCPGGSGTSLGNPGQTAVWGTDIDIHAHNTMPSATEGYFNLIIDWNQNGAWGDSGEHVIVNFFPIPNPFDGPISGLSPPNFVIGPNPGYVWARFTISESPVAVDWTGAEAFEDGESEDYLLLVGGDGEELEYGDAPEGDGKIAYPSLGVSGAFPTCKCCGPSGWVEHTNFGAWFGPTFDFETEGNAGLCPSCFPPYDQDECFQDGDAGLIIPDPFTIDNTNTVVPCPSGSGTPLGSPGQVAAWGINIDIHVHNTMPSSTQGYFNLIIDWNQNGAWGDPGEHVVMNFFPIPNPFDGPISGLSPPNFVIGSNPGYVWARFTISERPVAANWNGEDSFEDGESEDYLLQIKGDSQNADLDCEGNIVWTNVKRGATVNATFKVKNIGPPTSMLNWRVKSDPGFGVWTFTPSSGSNLAGGSSKTVIASCVAPKHRAFPANKKFTGNIEVENSDNPADTCKIPVELTTPRSRDIHNTIIQRFIMYLRIFFPFFAQIII